MSLKLRNNLIQQQYFEIWKIKLPSRAPKNKHSCRTSDIIFCGPRASEGKRVSARSKKFSRGVATKK